MIYNFHNFVKFEIIDHRNMVARKLDLLYNQYGYYIDIDSNDIDFTININDFEPENDGCSILDGKYYVKNNYFYCNDIRKSAKWKLEITDLESSPIVNLSVNFIGNISVLTNLIDFLIHLKMTEKGYPLIHASGVSKDGKGFAFAARSGGGKTTIATRLMEREFKYLGDNYIILNRNRIYNFFSPINLFTYNITPFIKAHMNYKQRFEIILKNVLYRLSRGYVKLSTKLNLFDIVPDKMMVESGLLNTLFLVIPKKNVKNIIIDEMSKKDLISHLVYNQHLEFMHMPFFNYLFAYSYVFPNSIIKKHWNHYEESLYNAIGDDVNIFKIEVPQKYDDLTFGEILMAMD